MVRRYVRPDSPGTLPAPHTRGASALYERKSLTDEHFQYTLRYEDRFENEVKLYREHPEYPDWIEVARELPSKEPRHWEVSDGRRVRFEMRAYPRRPGQEAFVDQVTDYLNEGTSGTAHAPTGMGKTVCMIEALSRYGRSALVIVPQVNLLRQWRARLVGDAETGEEPWTDLHPKQVGHVQGDIYHVRGCPIVLATLHSAALLNRYRGSFYRRFGVVVFDEVHRVAADQLQQACWQFTARVRWGLSATPYRTDGRGRTLAGHIGPVRVKAQTPTLRFRAVMIATSWRCPRRLTRDGDTEQVHHSAGRTTHILKSMVRHKERNERIVDLTLKAYKKGRKTILFFDLLKHIDVLRAQLEKAGIPGDQMARYVGGMSDAQLRDAAEARVILATYKMVAEGTDIPTLDTCVLVHPRARVEQAVGRVLRVAEGKKTPLVLDLVDSDSPVFRGYAKSRKRFYQRRNAELYLKYRQT